MTIHEPMTMLTDCILSALCLYWGFDLLRSGRRFQQRGQVFWGGAFLSTSLAGLAGALVHGFPAVLDIFLAGALWKAVLYTIGIASFCLLAAVATTDFSPPWTRRIQRFGLFQLATYSVLASFRNEFVLAIINYGVILVFVLGIEIKAIIRTKALTAKWLASGILISIAGSILQQKKIGLSDFFNHNDVYHVIQMGAFYLLWRGARLSRDRGASC